ncbi:type III PLP-dependent enzyme, partial [Marinitenerispora sediminis]
MTDESGVQSIPFTELARRFGTPLFVYDGDVLAGQYRGLRARLHPALEIRYSLKANPNVSICALLRSLGAGAEVSSLAELLTARRAGVPAAEIMVPGPGKSRAELAACVDEGVHAILCESLGELSDIDELGRARGVRVPVALRVNPAFEARGAGLAMGGRPRQFGIDEDQLADAVGLARGLAGVRLIGIHVYLGTRILDEDVIVANTRNILELADRQAGRLGLPLELVGVGGGLGVAYFDGERDLDPVRLAEGLNPLVAGFRAAHPATRLVLELGRYLTAPSGTYVVGVRHTKRSMGERFAVTDGGTHHHMAAVGIGSFVKRNFPMRLLNRTATEPAEPWHVTGPLCTPNDTLGRNVALPPLRPGDLLGVLRSGAYGLTASPTLFLGHGRPAEVLVHQGTPYLIRERDRPEELLRGQLLHDLAPEPGPA